MSTTLQPLGPSGLAGGLRSQSNAPAGLGLDSLAVRRRMVDGLRLQGLRDERVLAAMLAVERHRFVDSALVNQAYEDTSLPIGWGQTITKPGVVARMVELLLAPRARSGATPVVPGVADGVRLGRVLEIGSGCGYQAAVLAQVAGGVYSIERLRGLYDKARENLKPMKLHHVHLMLGDGMLGYAKGAPYDAIIAAAGGEALPDAWLDQLALGGRLVAPVAVPGGQQCLMVVDRHASGLQHSLLEPVHFVPLKSGIG
jgi:protein-L-isoaspartate(D-aspartate) O-methyltransferase